MCKIKTSDKLGEIFITWSPLHCNWNRVYIQTYVNSKVSLGRGIRIYTGVCSEDCGWWLNLGQVNHPGPLGVIYINRASHTWSVTHLDWEVQSCTYQIALVSDCWCAAGDDINFTCLGWGICVDQGWAGGQQGQENLFFPQDSFCYPWIFIKM